MADEEPFVPAPCKSREQYSDMHIVLQGCQWIATENTWTPHFQKKKKKKQKEKSKRNKAGDEMTLIYIHQISCISCNIDCTGGCMNLKK